MDEATINHLIVVAVVILVCLGSNVFYYDLGFKRGAKEERQSSPVTPRFRRRPNQASSEEDQDEIERKRLGLRHPDSWKHDSGQ